MVSSFEVTGKYYPTYGVIIFVKPWWNIKTIIKYQKTSGSFANKCSIVFGLCVIMGVNERTIYQKICYVLTRNGVDTGFSFLKGTYGPYSVAVKESITALANANLITEQTLGCMVSMSVADSVVIQKEKFSQDEWLAMKKTVDLFGRVKSTEQAEIIATVLFSYDELKKQKQMISDKEVYDFVLSWKPHWKQNKEYELCDTIHNLAMLSLISISHSDLLMDTVLL